MEFAGDRVPPAIGVRARVEGSVAVVDRRGAALARRARLGEPPSRAAGRVGGAGLLPVDAPEPGGDVRVVGCRRRLEILDCQDGVDVRAPGTRAGGGVCDVEGVHVLARSAGIVVGRVACEVEDLRAGAGGSLRPRHGRRRRDAVVHERRSGRRAGAGALPGEVHNRAAGRRVVVRVGDVGCSVGRVDRDLEEVQQGAVAASGQVAVQSADADRAGMDDVVAGLELAPGRPAIDRLRHVDVPRVLGVVVVP